MAPEGRICSSILITFMDNKQIFENWRGFIRRTELLENRDYIQYVLGIHIPLNESVPFSPALSQRILQEQLLLEGFFDKAVQKVKQGASALGSKAVAAFEDGKAWVKEFGNKVGLLFHSLWKIMRNPTEVQKYIDTLQKRNEIRKLPTLEKFVDNLSQLFGGTPFAGAADNIQNIYFAAVEQYDKMQTSWKKALLGSTLTVFMDYVISKFKDVITKVQNVAGTATDAVKEKLGEEIQGVVLSFFKNSFGDLFSKASQYMSGIGAWADWIGKIVGGIDYVATSLFGTTRDFAQDPGTAPSPEVGSTPRTDLSSVAPASSVPDVTPAQ